MVDLDWKTKMHTCNSPTKSPRLSSKLTLPPPPPSLFAVELSPASDSSCAAYEHYLRLPELKSLWSLREFPDWENESVLRPALQALELTFRLVSTVFSDLRPYQNRLEWTRRLETLATTQVGLIALLCEDGTRGTTPTIGLDSSDGMVPRTDSSTEVWMLSGGESVTAMVNRGSEASLLPRLAAWHKSEEVALKIQYSIECNMRRCPYTLGLGEPNLGAKPSLDYDRLCKPAALHCLKKSPMSLHNFENKTLYATHQIFETWVYFSLQLLGRIENRIGLKEFGKASTDCWVLERTWRLLEEIEDLLLLMDPNDFLRLKSQLSIKALSESEAFCFWSKGLVELTKRSKELRHKVPHILGVEVDPKGGPRIQESAMELYRRKEEPEKIHLLQAMQGVESALKRFYYAYKQLVVSVMGSVEAKGNGGLVAANSGDLLTRIFLEPTYFPSLDAAKTFLGDYWSHNESL